MPIERRFKLNTFFTILFMAVIGSIIAGTTNHLAIKMLFRPHNAKFIGKYKVPFTPGLIPKRRNELAIQLGVTVEEYLMTPAMLKNKLENPELKTKLEDFLIKTWEDKYYLNEKTIKEYLIQYNQWNKIEKIENKVEMLLIKKIDSFKKELDKKMIKEVLGNKEKEVAKYIPILTQKILYKSIEFLDSQEGEDLIKKTISSIVEKQGSLGSVLGNLVKDNSTLHRKIRIGLIDSLKKEETYFKLEALLRNEYQSLLHKDMSLFTHHLKPETIANKLLTSIKKEVDLNEKLDKKLTDYLPTLDDDVRTKYIPYLQNEILSTLYKNVEKVLYEINIKELVKEEVDKFPVQVLEDLLLGISKKEFKMITYLGFLLGFVIGIVQGVIFTIV